MTKLQKVTLWTWLLSIPYYFISQRLAEDMIAPIHLDLLAIGALLVGLTLATLIQWLVRQYKLGAMLIVGVVEVFNLVIYFIKVSKMQIAAIARKTNNSSVQDNWYLYFDK